MRVRKPAIREAIGSLRGLRGRRAFVPLVFLVAGLLATVLLWRGLVNERREQFRSLMATAAEDGRRAVSSEVETQLRGLRNVAAFWARFGRQPLAEWQADAEMVMEQVPGVKRLAWIDTTRDAVWVASGSEPARMRRLAPEERTEMHELLDGAVTAESARIEGPFRSGEGYAYRVYVPVRLGDATRGVLAATADVDATLDPILARDLARFAVIVRWNGVPIFQRGRPDTSHLSWWSGARGPVKLSLGPVWEVEHRPTEAVHEAVLTPLPNYLLYVGAFASLLLAALAHEMQIARSRARRLEVSYHDLDARMADTQEAQRALRGLNAELERRVELRTRELHQAVADLESFNDTVSHDLRSPLGAIQNLTAILQEDCQEALGEDELALLDRVQHSAGSAIQMMDGLLELSRMGRAELKRRVVDMGRIAREEFEDVIAAAESADVVFEIDPLPPARVDPALIRVVWNNLLRNAVKYSRDREKPHVSVSARREAGKRVYTVRDDGVGFDMRFAAKLFRPFGRLHSRDEFEGSGVGLALVDRVVQRHGGRVWAEAERGKGATFHFSIPADEEPEMPPGREST